IDEDDFHSAIDTLIAEGLADRERLAVCGYSYGGHMTNWLTSRSDRFAAAMSGGCVSNQASFYGNSDMGWLLGAFEVGAVLHDGEIFEAAAGVTNLDTKVPVTTDTVFQIGSMTKPYTTSVIMQFVDEGKLSLDEPIRAYLPNFSVADPDVSAKVTLRHLLS